MTKLTSNLENSHKIAAALALVAIALSFINWAANPFLSLLTFGLAVGCSTFVANAFLAPKGKSKSEGTQYEQIVENTPSNIVLANLEGIITYVNPESIKTLKTLEHLLPIKVDEILGSSYDVFHVKPEYQRKLLGDPTNLPHQAVIEVGDEKLDLLVSALYDDNNNYTGPMITWSIVTEKVRLEDEGAKSSQMLADMPINILLADKEGKVTFMNESSRATLMTLEDLLPVKVDEIVGGSYDVFHKVPEHQRKLLADPKNLPHQAIIEVGEEKLDLLVTALYDAHGEYSGPMVSWSVVTEKLRLEDEGAQSKQMLADMPINILLADKEGKVTFMNESSRSTLMTLEDLLPVKVDEIVGGSYDVFHKVPSHQRKILSDPSNLPHQAIIEVGEEKLDLLVTALYNAAGEYTGPMVSWSVVTAKLKLEEEGAKSQQMLANMPINILLADKDGIVTFMNESSRKTLKTLEGLLPVSVEDIVGGSYDVFHKTPERQRKLLSDPKNLPHQTVIEVGEEKLDLLVTALYDASGEYAGPMVSWSVVTEQLAREARDKHVRNQITENVTSLGNSVKTMEANSEGLYSGITNVSNDSEEVKNYISSVNVAAEELVTSINEISKNTDEVATMTNRAVDETEATERLIQDLQTRSQEIGEILKVVTEIANQTNLLALNATIEAARAGEAGKGFAVVANEVKELANRTAEATGDIGEKIIAIQGESEKALNSINTTTTSIKSVNELTVTVASSIEEQSAVTAEIGRSMKNSSEKVNEMASSVNQIQDLVQSNVKSVDDVNGASSSLNELVQ